MNRIIGGSNTKPNQYPWIVQIHSGVKADGNLGSMGGGSIISPRFILTAAHNCDYDHDENDNTPNIFYSPHQMRVFVGAHLTLIHEKRWPAPEHLGKAKTVQDIIIHDQYNPANNKHHDFALLKLESAIRYNNKVGPVCLPSSLFDQGYYNQYTGDWAKAIGWGTTTGTTNTYSFIVKCSLK